MLSSTPSTQNINVGPNLRLAISYAIGMAWAAKRTLLEEKEAVLEESATQEPGIGHNVSKEQFADSFASCFVLSGDKDVVAVAFRENSNGITILMANNKPDLDADAKRHVQLVWFLLRQLAQSRGKEGISSINPDPTQKAQRLKESQDTAKLITDLQKSLYKQNLDKQKKRINKGLSGFKSFIKDLGEIQDQNLKEEIQGERILEKLHTLLMLLEKVSRKDVKADDSVVEDMKLISKSSYDLRDCKFSAYLSCFISECQKDPRSKLYGKELRKHASFPIHRYLKKINAIGLHFAYLVHFSTTPTRRPLFKHKEKLESWPQKTQLIRVSKDTADPEWQQSLKILGAQFPDDGKFQEALTTAARNFVNTLSEDPAIYSGLTPHCEVKISEKTENIRSQERPTYVGVSKLSCAGCNIYFKVRNTKVRTRGAHGKYYFPYVVPTSTNTLKLREMVKLLMEDFRKHIRRTAFSPGRSESTIPGGEQFDMFKFLVELQ
ncbi:unnamed protein product [Cyclocybe aegerita]|uniref:Uncharacterized protein n=1 Tax=Cyclocybe aegerita TaxID=1973307 RepID=A0A8S0VRA6_CYCAE|nr:unnamed protein product [Cyclocybe aegerita]